MESLFWLIDVVGAVLVELDGFSTVNEKPFVDADVLPKERCGSIVPSVIGNISKPYRTIFLKKEEGT
ncbi:hypothetical protein D3C77_694610 [compost metagenome]